MTERVTISSPGCYDIPEDAYHADPCPEPSLSNSIAVKLLTESPLHAWHAHPRLNPHHEPPDAGEHLDNGAAAHELILRGRAHRLHVIDADSYRTKVAQSEREQARAAGAIPILGRRYDEAVEMVGAVRRQLAQHEEGKAFLSDFTAEQTVVWRDGPSWCRALVDALPNTDGRYIVDLKTTGGSAQPRDWIRNHLYVHGYDMQAAWYLRGLRAVGRKPAGFAFVVIENKPPYALSVVTLDPAAVALAERKVARALAIWRECMKTGVWPGYSERMAWAEPLPWDEQKFAELEAMEAYAA